MKKLLLLLLAFCPLAAAEKPWFVSVGANTDYVTRYTTQSLNKPTAFIYGEYSKNGFYAATFFSTMDFGDGTTLELDGFAGYRFNVNDWKFDLGFLYIGYPNDKAVNWDMQEYDLKISKPFNSKLTGNYTLGYSPDYFNVSGPSLWNQLGLSYCITDKLSVSGSVGYQWIMETSESYGGFDIGLTYQLTPVISLDARYADTNRHDLPLFYGNSFALTIRFSY